MRITANIIDEDGFSSDKPPAKGKKPKQRSARKSRRSQEHFIPPPVEYANAVNHLSPAVEKNSSDCIINDSIPLDLFIKKFRLECAAPQNILSRSEQADPKDKSKKKSRTKCTKWHDVPCGSETSGDKIRVHTPDRTLDDVIPRFSLLNLSGDDKTDSLLAASAFAPKPLEKATGDPAATGLKMDPLVPVWLMRYLSTMKQQIKKEIMDEICPIHQYLKSAKTEENQIDFQGEVIHTGIFCDNCDQLIHGIRYKCGNCLDFDLCQECESLPNIHNKRHIFLKIRYPVALKLNINLKKSPKWTTPDGKTSKHRQLKKLYEAKFVRNETIPDSTVLSPSSKFVKSWKVVNSGTRVWTHATKLQLIQGSQDLVPFTEEVDVPHLKPGEEGIVSVFFSAPSQPGMYRSHWNFCHKSRPFGDIVWCHIIVKPEEETSAPPLQATNEAPESSNATNKMISPEILSDNKQTEVSSIAEVLTAVQKEHDKGNLVPRKLAVSSHTTTPNNTPFDLSPPKSPDHHVMTSAKDLSLVVESFPEETKDSDNEDDCSVVSLGSADSDTEFVVIPMPKCFNLSESFVTQHMPQMLQENLSDSATNTDEKNNYHVMNVDKQEIAVICEDVLSSSPTAVKRPSPSVSQETGVPELSVIYCDNTVLEIMEKKINSGNTSFASAGHGSSSSEVSIIDSGSCSPVSEQLITVENGTQTVNISLLSEGFIPGSEVEKIQVHIEEGPGLNRNSNITQGQQTDNQEPSEGNLGSATFPKFPIEGITNTFDPTPGGNTNKPETVDPSNQPERVVQVLPEGLVTGALSAAASVYNTALAVMSTIQQPRSNEPCLSHTLPSVAPNESILRTYSQRALSPMDQLIEMGFCNRQRNEELLRKYDGDVNIVVDDFVNMDDNDWYASRHIPSPPPAFD